MINNARDPRYCALMVLLDNEQTKKTLNRTIDRYSTEFNLLSKRDRALANTLIHGVLRYRGKLDWIISCFSTKKINKLDPAIIYLLRIGLFQIIFLDKIPISAAVNTSVEITKKISNKGAAGFVNAVLRKAGTRYSDLVLPDINKKPGLFISIEKSLPLWLAEKWIKRFSLKKTIELCDAINEIPPITIRTNTLKIKRDVLAKILANQAETVMLTKYAENGISLSKPLNPLNEMEAFKKGYFQVQDEAAQIVTSILDPRPGESILDACAGLGGKTGHIGQLMQNQGKIIAIDVNENKLIKLAKEMKRLGISIVSTQNMDILKQTTMNPEPNYEKTNSAIMPLQKEHSYFNENADFKENGKIFHRVLLDAPCTGLGVLKRNPDTRWTRSLKDIIRLSKIQKAMLIKTSEYVKPGGILVYSVCSCEPEENEDVINYFLKKRHDFSINNAIPLINDKCYKTMISEKGFFRTYPDNSVMDGFFAVSMKRKN